MHHVDTVELRKTVWEYYHHNRRDLPWRHEPFDVYHILVSEIMLQQTQVSRVIPKYQDFLQKFPNLAQLAAAPLSDVLKMWSGLGYNRRAKYVHEAAKRLMIRPQPWNLTDLVGCKGIGYNTAAAILTYTYNQPHIFIETNIRTILLYHLFANEQAISDKQLETVLNEMIDKDQPREFYWALMDYGSYLKATQGNSSQRSKHYTNQSVFQGSLRQVRGQIIHRLTQGAATLQRLQKDIEDDRLTSALDTLTKEGLIKKTGHSFELG